MPDLLSDANARLAAARRLTTRRGRHDAGLFLVEGAQAVREALAADAVVELFATTAAATRYPDLTASAAEISDRAATALSETVTPQGLVAVCRRLDGEPALAGTRLAVALVEVADPGNAGTVLRTADAAGATSVSFVGDTVDPYNGKAVRASAGSLFHVAVSLGDVETVLAAARAAGLQILATSGAGDGDLDDLIDGPTLARPTLWLFGHEAHGLDPAVIAQADAAVRISIPGRAESLNLAAAAAVCLFASARAQRR